MAVPAAPRIDVRLRRRIASAHASTTSAELTRQVGELAWRLGLQRPSYQQVRVLRRTTRRGTVQTSRGRVLIRYVARAVDTLYEYPGPGLESAYRRFLEPRYATDCYKRRGASTRAQPPP